MQKKVLIIVSPRDFRDEEYFIPKGLLKKAALTVDTASTALGIAYGVMGGEAEVNLLLEKVEVKDYAAVVFIGGPGARSYFDHPEVHRIAQEAAKMKMVLAAICIAPVILARSGVLAGRRATVWTSALDKSAVRDLERGEATYLAEELVIDDNIITAQGPAAASKFAAAIIHKLQSSNL
ncbi:MAG: protease I [Parcubacteria group bacterium LiPW_72]|nr:MAG: protease I [Parcubacteria group bacterium LiPW_72]